MRHAWLMFVAGAILTWGAYVVTIDHGRATLAGTAHGGKLLVPMPVAAMRAFLFIGLAYFVLGVLVPAAYLWLNPVDRAAFPADPGWVRRGVVLSTLAGILGAAGALCIVFAVGAARRALGPNGAAYVAPLVFCFAPIVNVLISLVVEPPERSPSPLFFVGIVLAAVGAGMVLYFKPAAAPHAPAGPAAAPAHVTAPVPAPAPATAVSGDPAPRRSS
ncbi:MAG TPA: hypothetical protein VFB66_30940 [Tepidisphaeraceae bacterium]|nr:hypothetical protein [Tepidisphaeraceae bacterium]